METATASTSRKRLEIPSVASLVKKGPAKTYDPNDPNAPKPPVGSKMLGGIYRVIHGRLILPLPLEARRLGADGALEPDAPKTFYAEVGDEVLLPHADAERMLDADVVEPLDARPSRVGKVWRPPPVKPNAHGGHSAR